MEKETLDPSIIALTKAIGRKESQGKYDAIGDNGHSKGAYQWNNKKAKLQPDEIPENFRSFAVNVKADGNDFSPENQDRVAYKTVEKWGREGLTPAQIASKWNSGGADNYKTQEKGYNAEQGVHHDVKSYVNEVAKFYEEFSKGTNSNTQKKESIPTARKTFNDIPDEKPTETPMVANRSEDMKQQYGQTGGGILGEVSRYVPGNKMAQAAGYGLSGNQKGLIEANDQAMNIQGQLIQRIKENKGKGKDTSRLQKALDDLTADIQKNAGKVPGLGTGGFTNKEVLKDAGKLAVLPAMAYGSTVLGGGGIMGTARGLKPGVLGSSAPKVFNSTAVTSNVNKLDMSNKGWETLEQALNPISNMKKFTSAGNLEKVGLLEKAMKTANRAEKVVIQQAIDKILPRAIKEAGGKVPFSALYPKWAKVFNIGKKATSAALGGTILGAGINKGMGIVDAFKKD